MSSAYMTMRDMAAQKLREAILKGKYPPDTRLLPGRLVDELDLGLAAIRDALRELTGSGLVVSSPNKGYYVTFVPGLEEVKEIFKMRFTLEVKAAEKGASCISGEDLAGMERLHEEMSRKDVQMPGRYFFPNREFHLTLYRATGWKTLCRVIEHLLDLILIFQSTLPDVKGDYNLFNSQHLRIIQAIKDNDEKRVGEYIRKNLNAGLDNIFSKRERAKNPGPRTRS